MRRCEKTKKDLMESSPLIIFMLKHLRLSGCQVPEKNIFCVPCASPFSGCNLYSGAYLPHPNGALKLCAGHFFSKQHAESTIAHELVHMFDECRFKVDWNNLRHHACSEIRANNLSGDCRYTRELRRGFVSFTKQHQACVRRRAIVSVAANPVCPSFAHAERAVNEVWESCSADTRPFDEIY
ncbi:peptidase M76 [Rhodocollybia butyracea]|uniref:Mitochondrial inner membrane protease ATP23 n=1 Tax=Rhodocollybia butyracea TaxID=206335 RepID=A0A9P5PKQ1_9AGAR|nr:peptidase M76 [Rhodocollybia butyracea]